MPEMAVSLFPAIQHAGPKLTGYATSTTTTTTVAQNATPGFLRSVIVFPGVVEAKDPVDAKCLDHRCASHLPAKVSVGRNVYQASWLGRKTAAPGGRGSDDLC